MVSTSSTDGVDQRLDRQARPTQTRRHYTLFGPLGPSTSTRGTPPPHASRPGPRADAGVDPQAERPGLEAQARRPDLVRRGRARQRRPGDGPADRPPIVDDVIVRRRRAAVAVAGAAGRRSRSRSSALAYLRRYHGGRSRSAVQYDLRNQHARPPAHPRPAHLDRLSTGQLVARASCDTDAVPGLLNFLPLMIGNVLMMLMSLVVMFWLSPLLACVGAGRSRRRCSSSPTGCGVRVFPATLGRPAARGRGRRRSSTRTSTACAWSRRSGRRSASCTGWSTSSRRSTARGCARPGCRPATSRCSRRSPPSPRSPCSALGGWLVMHGRDHARHLPGVLDVRRPVRRAGPAARRRAHHRPAGPRRRRADLPAARPRARRSPTRPTRSSCPRCAARSSFATCTSATTTRRRAARPRPPRRGRASGSRSSAPSGSGKSTVVGAGLSASTTPTRARSWSTATTCAT